MKCFNCQEFGHYANECRNEPKPRNKPTHDTNRGPNVKKVYKCKTETKYDTPKKLIGRQTPNEDEEIEARLQKCKIKGTVNGKCVTIGRDSQCTQTVVSADLVPADGYTGKFITVRGITGPVELPLAEVDLQCEIVSGKCTVAVAPGLAGLQKEVLLGHDLDKSCGEIIGQQTKKVCVLTRQQAKQRYDERKRAEQELFEYKQGLPSHKNLGITNDSRPFTNQLPMDDWIDVDVLQSLFMENNDELKTPTDGENAINTKEGMDKSEIKEDRHMLKGSEIEQQVKQSVQADKHENHNNVKAIKNQNEWPNVNKDSLRNLQNSDETLTGVRQRKVPSDEIKNYRVCFYSREGVLMRKWQKAKTKIARHVDPVHQIVVPEKYRTNILETAHDNTFAGHLGVEKTKDRILRHFYWPGIFQDVAKYCRTCPKCQMMDKSKMQRRAPLIPMPIIDTPFKRIGIDIVGPMKRSRQRYKYLLTICDYATRYPEAIPITNLRTETVANALITVFSMVGIPEEIVHDQGSQFMSDIMAKICQKLQITQIHATAYHQQTNGMTERFHDTLKNMMRSLSNQEMKVWDEFIPHFLFAYREVPSQATGYSPFELLYGRHVRGPLDVIKENWVDTRNDEPKDVVTYLLDMRTRMTKWMQDANQNLSENQAKMKTFYDKKARVREFESGERVLIFLPESAAKLDSKWCGPYTIVRKINKVNYLVKMHDKRKAHRVFHVNMLKKWYDREQEDFVSQCFCIIADIDQLSSQYKNMYENEPFEDMYEEIQSDSEPVPVKIMDDSVPNCKQTQDWTDIKIPDELSNSQKSELKNVFQKHENIFSDVPGRTHLVSHTIRTKTDTPVRQRIYRTPHALRDKIKKELDSMLDLGIIEPANSPYASPITVVVKPGGKDIRICSDLRAINEICIFDPYEMPRIDDILDEVSGCKFISTLDLTKGFYQVPLDPKSPALSLPLGSSNILFFLLAYKIPLVAS